jgi:hypothetical protein
VKRGDRHFIDDNLGTERDIILHQRGGGLERISDKHPAYDPMHFRLLFPHGELGWHLSVRYKGDTTSHKNNRVPCREFAAYRLIGHSMLYRTARLFMRDDSKLTTKMRVPSLPGLPVTSRLVSKNNKRV